jgi:signal transduction histidine kinase
MNLISIYSNDTPGACRWLAIVPFLHHPRLFSHLPSELLGFTPAMFVAHMLCWQLCVAIIAIGLVLGLAAAFILRQSLRELHLHLDSLYGDSEVNTPPHELLLDLARPRHAIQLATAKVDRIREGIRRSHQDVSEREQKHLEWLAYLSHDLSTPLHRVMARLQAIGDPATDEQDRTKLLETAENESSEVADVLGSISQMASLEREVDRKFVLEQLDELLDDTLEAFEFEASQREILLSLEVSQQLGPASIERNLLRRAIDNLVSNALRHTPPGGTVIIGLEEQTDRALIWVRDTGTGIPDDVIARVFEFAFRGDSQVRPAKVGSMGLGLAFVKMVADLHKGNVAVKNLEKGGSEFSISLPLYRVSQGSTGTL